MERFFATAILSVVAAASINAAAGQNNKEPYSAPVGETIRHLYWGDTHLHTRLSADAYNMETRLSAEQAYRFARGRQIQSTTGQPVRMRRPLDFLAVTDHGEYMGILPALAKGNPALQDWPLGRRWQAYRDSGKPGMPDGLKFGEAIQSQEPELQVPDGIRAGIWQGAAEVADRFNVPGSFTAFIAYEWTSMISGDNLHRVVLYRDGADKAGAVLPFTAQHSTDPEDLWQALADYEKDTGGQAMAIAHNGNVSNGRMFAPVRENGEPLNAAYASLRTRWETVYEVTQMKGDGETHPYLSPEDEFADFETWDEGNINLTQEKKPTMLQYEYARSALREGLRHQANLGVNPFKFGMIGSTDSHTGLATAEEDNFFGKFAADEPAAGRAFAKIYEVLQQKWKLGASGLAAVWAEENTREALFDAMKRREVYATTGPRIQVRFFGGWDFDEKDLARPDYAAVGYLKGVPMGGDLSPRSGGQAPSFLVLAAKDPDGANLDRIQVVKGWLDAAGKSQEKVYDVALSDSRTVNKSTGKAPAVGSTVNVAEASYTNTIGAPELSVVWSDPDFDSTQRAFYYLRVLEIPKPRWTARDASYFGVEMPDHVPMVVQDRAYTSPIWYTPAIHRAGPTQ